MTKFRTASLSVSPSDTFELVNLERIDNNASDEESAQDHLPPPIVHRGLLKPIPATTWSERLAAGAGCVAFLTSLAAMLIVQSFIVVIAGLLSSVAGVYLYWQQVRWTDLQAIIATRNALAIQRSQFEQSNKDLTNDIERLQSSVHKLQDLEHAAAVLNATESFTVDSFATQIQTNKGILKSLKSNVEAVVLQNLLSVILRSDTDRDLVISEGELDAMIEGMKHITGLSVNEDRLREACLDQSIDAIMDLVRDLVQEDGEINPNAVFRIESQD